MGRPHGLDGSFHVEAAQHALEVGTPVEVAGRAAVVARRAGTDARPIVRLSGAEDRTAAEALRGETLSVAEEADDEGAGDEWAVDDLVGCTVPGIGEVRRVIAAPSCDVLEVGDEAVLVPLVTDAVRRVDLETRTIEVNRRFLGLEDAAPWGTT